MSSVAAWTPYCGPAPEPAEWFERWNFDPILLAAAGLLFIIGWRLAPANRGSLSLAAGISLVLFVSPFCALGSALFAARAAHHLLLVILLAPLLAPVLGRLRGAEQLSLPLMTVLQALIFWLWHAPGLYALALSNDAVFWIMQVSITGSAALWWTAVRRAPAAAAVTALLATMVQMGLLGALLTFAGWAFYEPHWTPALVWGLGPMEDQQLGGLLMWTLGAAAYLLAALAILFRSIDRTDAGPVPT
jgi:putative membrane protein